MIAHDWNTCLLIFHLCSAGRDGLTHNMLNDIHNNWKHAEAVRIKCMGVPTVDMKNVCTQLEVSPSFKFNDIHFLCFFIPSCYCSSSELSCLNRYLFTLFMGFILQKIWFSQLRISFLCCAVPLISNVDSCMSPRIRHLVKSSTDMVVYLCSIEEGIIIPRRGLLSP